MSIGLVLVLLLISEAPLLIFGGLFLVFCVGAAIGGDSAE